MVLSVPLGRRAIRNAPQVLNAEATVSPNNSLIINIEVTVDTDSRVSVEYENPGVGRFRSRTTESLDTSHTISVVRLRPSTTYCYQVFAEGANGQVSYELPGTFKTCQLPALLQEASFTLQQGQPSYPLTLLDYEDGGFNGMVMLDSQANVVWYYGSDEARILAIAQKPNGNLVHQLRSVGIREITPLGEEVSRLDELCVSPDSSGGRWHHEVLLRPCNKALLLGWERHDTTETLGPEHGLQKSDTVEEWDQDTGESQVLFDIFDFIPVTDRTETSNHSTSNWIRPACPKPVFEVMQDWTHANSLSATPRGNIIIPMRHLNQIISIAPDFQSIEWRLGGPGGQFDFSNPADQFYHQHSAVELPNENILLFDNGNTRPSEEGGEYTRALELKLDSETMTATKVWEYRHDPDLFNECCGYVTRLPGGNTVISFGFFNRTFVEADSEGNAVAVMKLETSEPNVTYRAQPIDSIFGESELPPRPPPTPPPGGAIQSFASGLTTVLTSPDDKVSVTVLAEASVELSFLSYDPKTPGDAPEAPPAGLAFGITLFDLQVLNLYGVPAPDARFLSPITISVRYTNDDIQVAEGNPSTLSLHKYDPTFQSWIPVTTTFDPVTKTVQTRVSQLSFFALMGPGQPLNPTPTTVPDSPTATLLPPTPGDVAPGSGLLIGMLIAGFILIAAGSYYLRQGLSEWP